MVPSERRRPPVALATLAVALVTVGTARTGGAEVTALSPASGEVEPGGRATASVKVEAGPEEQRCLSVVRPPEPTVGATVARTCDTGKWSTRLTVSTTSATPVGDYQVVVHDADSSRSFLLHVVAPSTTTTSPPPSTTSTQAGPAPTTAPPSSTTTRPPATAKPTTTTRPGPATTAGPRATTTTTEAAAGPGDGATDGAATPPGRATTVAGARLSPGPVNPYLLAPARRPDGEEGAQPLPVEPPGELALAAPPAPAGIHFASMSALLAAGLGPSGLFLPLHSPAYGRCLPLAAPCGDGEGGLVLVPPQSAEIQWWEPPGTSPLTLGELDLDVGPLEPVGTPPAETSAVSYVLPVLDLGAGVIQVRGLPRGLDEHGRLVRPASPLPPLVPAAVGPAGVAAGEAPTEPLDVPAESPFAKPYRLSAEDVDESSPALALFAGTSPEVLYGVRADPLWGLDREFVPLLGTGSLPHLVRAADGAVGLLVPMPPGLDAPAAVAGGRPPVQSGDFDPRLPLWLVAYNAVLAALLLGSRAVRRRALPRERGR